MKSKKSQLLRNFIDILQENETDVSLTGEEVSNLHCVTCEEWEIFFNWKIYDGTKYTPPYTCSENHFCSISFCLLRQSFPLG